MKSQKAQSQSIDLNKIASDEASKNKIGIPLSSFYTEICSKLGIKFQTSYNIKEMILNIQAAGFEILSVRDIRMPKNCTFDMGEKLDTEWNKKFFLNVMFPDDEDGKRDFEAISKTLGEVYLINELEIKSMPLSFKYDPITLVAKHDQAIHIYGIPEEGENKAMVLIMAVLAPY